jgi:hypothetical protein
MTGSPSFCVAAVVCVVAGLSLVDGCGSPDCTEKATCADPPSTPIVDAGHAESGDGCNASSPDCANPKCQAAYTCTAPAPSGWLGPVALSDQENGPPLPQASACSGAYSNNAFEANSNPAFVAASCSCACSSVKAECTRPIITVYSDNQCGPNNCGTGADTVCGVVDGPHCSSGGQSAKVTAPPQVVGSGSCDAAVSVISTPSSSWTGTARGCGAHRTLEAGGCTNHRVCADKPSSDFAPTLCVWRHADLSDCTTATGYPRLQGKFYTGVTDDRGCALGSCSCATSADVGCYLAAVASYSTTDCSGMVSSLDVNPKTCNEIGNDTIVSMIATVAVTGSCPTLGTPMPTGTVAPDPTTAITVCCAEE